jgi:alkylmercury lyase
MAATADFIRVAQEAGLNLLSRQRQLAGPTRALHRAVLQAFIDTGVAPGISWLADQASRLGLEPDLALQELADADLVHLENSSVVVAYPFCGVPTPDSVQLEGGPSVYAMCAIDALGIPLMAGTDGVISSADPQRGVPIRVIRNGLSWEWSPASTVVVAGFAQSCATAAETCCPHVAFYASAEGAGEYLQNHAELAGAVLDPADAVALADLAFGSLLSHLEPEA